MSVTTRLIEVTERLKAISEEGRNLQRRLIALSEQFITAELLADAEVDEFGIQFTKVCALKTEAMELVKKKRELQSAVAAG